MPGHPLHETPWDSPRLCWPQLLLPHQGPLVLSTPGHIAPTLVSAVLLGCPLCIFLRPSLPVPTSTLAAHFLESPWTAWLTLHLSSSNFTRVPTVQRALEHPSIYPLQLQMSYQGTLYAGSPGNPQLALTSTSPVLPGCFLYIAPQGPTGLTNFSFSCPVICSLCKEHRNNTSLCPLQL